MIGLGLALGLRSGGGGAAPPAAKTYDDFKAHIATLATGGSRVWNSNANIDAGAYRTTASSSLGGAMTGSPWQSVFRGTIPVSACRIVQHSLPDFATFQDQNSAVREIFFRVDAAADVASFSALNRNSFTSDGNSATTGARIVVEALYWDGTQAQRMQPSLGLGPTPYDWVIP